MTCFDQENIKIRFKLIEPWLSLFETGELELALKKYRFFKNFCSLNFIFKRVQI